MPSKRNVIVLSLLAPLLLGAGITGIARPSSGRMSTALPYNLFHIAFGLLGLRIALSRRENAARSFNFVFGLIDAWQAFAGVTGLFPSRLFGLRPADHIAHVAFGAFLIRVACPWTISSRDDDAASA